MDLTGCKAFEISLEAKHFDEVKKAKLLNNVVVLKPRDDSLVPKINDYSIMQTLSGERQEALC